MGQKLASALLCGAAWAAAALSATAASAQSAAAAPPSPATASTGAATTAPATDEIIVTARQRKESLKNVPIAVTALTGDTLKQEQINSLKDVAPYTPGLNINSDSVGRAFISIRGIGTTLIGTVQPGVGIFVDGIYQPNTSYLNSPLVDVERVEVLRGPQGTLFGNNTLGGAINVITRQPSNTYTARVDGAYAGDDDYRSLSASVSGPVVRDLLSVRLGAAYHQQDGFQYRAANGDPTNPLVQQSVNGTARFTPAPWATITANVSHDRIRGGDTPYVDVTGPTDHSLVNTVNQTSLATINFDAANVKGEFQIDPLATKVTAVAAYNRRDLNSDDDGDFGPVDFIRSRGRSRLITQTGELRFDTTWSGSISTLVGLFADRSTDDQFSLTTLVPLGISAPAALRATNDTQAVYGTLFWKLQPSLDLAVGVRVDHQTLSATNAGSAGDYERTEAEPRITLTKRWTPDVMTYGSISRGVRGGGQNGPGAPNLIYNGDSVWVYELGSKFTTLGRKLSIDTDVFFNDYDDFIGQNSLAPSTTGAGFVAVNLNTGHVNSYGAEAEAHYRVTPYWRIDAGLTLLHARITNDDEYFKITGFHVSSDRVIFTPDWNFNLGTNYVVPVGQDQLVFDAALIGKGDRIGSSLDPAVAPNMHAYYLVNGSIAYRFGDGLELALFGTNIFDERYLETYIDRSALVRAGLGAIATDLAVQGDRRRVGVRFSYRY